MIEWPIPMRKSSEENRRLMPSLVGKGIRNERERRMNDLMYSLYNFRSGEYDDIDAPETDDMALDYLPQLPAARRLYRVYRAKGEDIIESMRLVLMVCVGEGDS